MVINASEVAKFSGSARWNQGEENSMCDGTERAFIEHGRMRPMLILAAARRAALNT
jgi:hypothetical protein